MDAKIQPVFSVVMAFTDFIDYGVFIVYNPNFFCSLSV